MKMTDKFLSYMATTAEEAFWEALGLASQGCAYEPEISEEVKAYKNEHTSKIVSLYNKITK